MMNMRTLKEKLGVRYIFYLLLLIVTMFPIIRPIGLPIAITQPTRDLYKGIQAIPPGSNVLYAPDMGASNIAELVPGAVAVLRDLIKLPVKIVMATFTWDQSILIMVNNILPQVNFGSKKYGEDYVNLGYFAGIEVSMASFAADVQKTAPTDFYGKSTKDMPIMQKIRNAKDFYCIIVVGGSAAPYYVRQFQAAYGVKLGIPTQTVSYPTLMPFYTSGQIFGLANGLRGAAEYEILSGNLGTAVASNDAISTSHVLILAFIVAGNVLYFYRKYKGKKE